MIDSELVSLAARILARARHRPALSDVPVRDALRAWRGDLVATRSRHSARVYHDALRSLCGVAPTVGGLIPASVAMWARTKDATNSVETRVLRRKAVRNFAAFARRQGWTGRDFARLIPFPKGRRKSGSRVSDPALPSRVPARGAGAASPRREEPNAAS